VVTNANNFYVGAGTNNVGNYMVITNGGQVFSKGATPIGNLAGANSNWVYVGGSPGVGTNATWNLGGSSLTLGGAASTGNYVMVAGGGILTNGSVTMLGVGSRVNVNGGTLGGGVAGTGTVYVANGGMNFNAGASNAALAVPLVEDPPAPAAG